MNILVCGDRGWSSPEVIKQSIAIYNPEEDVIYYELEPGAATFAMGLAKQLGFKTKVFRPTEFVGVEQMNMVLAFHNFIRNSKRTWAVIKSCKLFNIPYRVINSKNEVTDMHG